MTNISLNKMELLPPELIMNICEKMDLETLSKITNVSWRYYNICRETWAEKIAKNLTGDPFFIKDDLARIYIYVDDQPELKAVKLRQYNLTDVSRYEEWPVSGIIPERKKSGKFSYQEALIKYKYFPDVILELQSGGYRINPKAVL